MAKRKFEREAENKIISGVCGGLARYFGLSSRLVRFAFFISIFFSASLTFWIYILFWLIAPQRRSTRENLSYDLKRQVRKLDRLVDDVCERMTLSGLEARLRSVQDLVETLLPDFEMRSLNDAPELRPVYEAALVHLPKLLGDYLALPDNYAKAQTMGGGQTAQEQLAGELLQLETSLAKVAARRYGQKFNETAVALDHLQNQLADDPTAPFRKQLEALQTRAVGRLDDEALAKIETIKQSLLAALASLLQTVDEADPNLYNVRQIALEYLPATVDKYLALPQGLAASEPVAQGKTAQTVLHEQLDVLDMSLTKMLNSLYRQDAQGLLVQGHFLRDKFLDPQREWMSR